MQKPTNHQSNKPIDLSIHRQIDLLILLAEVGYWRLADRHSIVMAT